MTLEAIDKLHLSLVLFSSSSVVDPNKLIALFSSATCYVVNNIRVGFSLSPEHY